MQWIVKPDFESRVIERVFANLKKAGYVPDGSNIEWLVKQAVKLAAIESLEVLHEDLAELTEDAVTETDNG